MFIELDFNSNEAIYMQLRNQIILGIAQDKIKNGESLPSVRQLAEDIGVNMHTVNKAYALLRNDGYLKLDRRKGAVVCVTVESRKEQLEKVNLDMQMLVAEAICKDISLAEMHQIITDMYKEFGDIANGGNKETNSLYISVIIWCISARLISLHIASDYNGYV